MPRIFIIIQTAAFLITAALLVFLFFRFRRFFAALAGSRKPSRILTVFLPLLITGLLVLMMFRDSINGAIILLHLALFWLIADLPAALAVFLFSKFKAWRSDMSGQSLASLSDRSIPAGTAGTRLETRNTARIRRRRAAGILALASCAVYLSYGWYTAHHVIETDYSLQTSKNLGQKPLRIVQISDSHIGATFDGDGFAEHMKKIQSASPDAVLVTGDFVDDSTSAEDMKKGCAALGSLHAPLGVYFIFGNHDKGYYIYRAFTTQELRDELTANGVVILEDENVMLRDNVCLIGRRDRSDHGRMSMEELTAGVNMDCYTIVLDHQPHDFDAQARAGVDLVLCGHTHGGQMFPIGITGELTGANDKTYGLETRENTTFIVNSGISDWAIKFKTGGAVSEFGVIDILPAGSPPDAA